MDLKEIIEATLIELDRGTDSDTVNMYIKKFTMYANEAVDEIARRFKACKVGHAQLTEYNGFTGFDITAPNILTNACKRIVRILPADYDSENVRYTDRYDKKPLNFEQFVHGGPYIHVWGDNVDVGDYVAVEYLYVPRRLFPGEDPDNPGSYQQPDIPQYLHSLIPMYVRAREQCGQDPSTQGTANAYFSLFNQKVYQLQRETLATPESFQLKNYHFE